MSRIIVKFKKRADYDTRTEQAVSFICDLFGFLSPWFNDDTWLDDGRRTLIIGSGYSKTNVSGKINILKILYKEEIEEIYEELDDDEQSELEPCLCGGQVEIRDVIDGHDETFAIHCNSCHLHFTKFDWVARDRKDVIKDWNRRMKE